MEVRIAACAQIFRCGIQEGTVAMSGSNARGALAVSVTALSCVGISACKGSGTTGGTPESFPTLVVSSEIDPQDTGHQCPDGGHKVESGQDDGAGGAVARDGVLDAGEVDAVEYICAPTRSAISSVSELSSGHASCAYGGVQIDYGVDDGSGGGTEGDGKLHPDEVDATEYLCNDPPEAEHQALTATAPVPDGNDTCPFGGVTVVYGLDNGDGSGEADDGVLNDDEVDATRTLCNSAPPAQHGFLAGVVEIPLSHTECPFGGVQIDFGADDGSGAGTADDGLLHTDEVDVTEYICNEPPPAEHAPLTTVTELEEGDTECPQGGVRADYGLDDGAGGGIVDNGVLEAGEVVASRYICNQGPYDLLTTYSPLEDTHTDCPRGWLEQSGLDNGDGGGVARNGVLEPGEVDASRTSCGISYTGTPPGGSPGPFRIAASGGRSTGGVGGEGGELVVNLKAAATVGQVVFYGTGAADAGFEVPVIAGDLGTDPLRVNADMLIPASKGASGPYLEQAQYGRILDQSDQEITGIEIAVGVTLTFEANHETRVSFSLQSALVNHGILATVRSLGTPATIEMKAATFVGTQSSSIQLSGVNGGSGGGFRLDLVGSEAPAGAFYNRGGILTVGSDLYNGEVGTGGAVWIYAESEFFNAGDIVARGGSDTDVPPSLSGGAGASASDFWGVTLIARDGDLRNAGDVNTSSGSGATSGWVPPIRLWSSAFHQTGPGEHFGAGRVVNSGDLIASSGSASQDGQAAHGGGLIELTAGGGEVVNTGSLTAVGGNSTGAAGEGGDGGVVWIRSFFVDDDPNDDGTGPIYGAGSIFLSGSIDVSGGEGAFSGGDGNLVRVEVLASTSATWFGSSYTLEVLPNTDVFVPYLGLQIHFLGYGQPGGGILLNGGESTSENGGGGGSLIVNSPLCEESCSGLGPLPLQAVVNYVDVYANGGPGAKGGTVTFGAGADPLILPGTPFDEPSYVENHGILSALGGACTVPASTGGGGGSVVLSSRTGPSINVAAISVSGGDATQTGGAGGNVALQTERSLNTGRIDASGGDGTASGTGTGGNGGIVTIIGADYGCSTADAGSGEGLAGEPGEVVFYYGVQNCEP